MGPSWWKAAWLAALPLAPAVAWGWAQPHAAGGPGPKLEFDDQMQMQPWSELSLEDALAESKAKHRMLVVFLYDDSPVSERMLARTWPSHTMAAWLAWHAVAVKIDARNGIGATLRSAHKIAHNRLPATLIYVRGQGLKVFEHGGGGYLKTDPAERAVDIRPISPDPPDVAAARSIPGLLFNLQFTLERAKLMDVPWGLMHDQRNPEPDPPPKRDPLYNTDDGLADVVDDLPPGEGGAPPDVLGRLEEARAAARAGELRRAAGLYTWLWERGAEVEPAFAPLRLTVLAGEIAALVDQRQGVRERFAMLRDDATKRLLWAGLIEHDEWFILNAMVDRDDSSALYLVTTLVNDEEATMLSLDQQTGFKWMLARAPLDDQISNPGRFVEERLKAIAPVSVRRKRPNSVPPAQWEALMVFRDHWLVGELSRVYSVALKAGVDDQADRAAQLLLTSVSDQVQAGAQRSLVLAALAAGQVRPIHAQWLADAPASDPLRKRLAE